jgi:FkbM family methyltransferase
MRLIDAAWPLGTLNGDTNRRADLVYGGFKAPCDLRYMLQRQFYFFGTFYLERQLLARWSLLAQNAKVIFDVGSNAGIYSLAAVAANGQAVVHAFEPTPEIAERLRETVALNEINSLHVHELAVAEHPGKAALKRCSGGGDNDGMNYIRADDVAGDDLVVTESLDSFCKAREIRRVDLMKIDIQGNEAAALRGAAGLLSEGAIGTIFMELNWGAPGCKCPASEAVKILDNKGFLFASPHAQNEWKPAGDWMRAMSDIIAASQI